MADRYLNYINDCFSVVPVKALVGLVVVYCMGSLLLLKFLGPKRGSRWSAGLLLLEYLFLLLFLSVLSRAPRVARVYDFVPFWSYQALLAGKRHLLLPMIANVVAFIPIGLLLGISFPDIKWWKVLLIGGAFSLLVETLQFFLRRGFAEFDDVWHNVVGCMIGYGVYAGIVGIVKWMKKISNRGLVNEG